MGNESSKADRCSRCHQRHEGQCEIRSPPSSSANVACERCGSQSHFTQFCNFVPGLNGAPLKSTVLCQHCRGDHLLNNCPEWKKKLAMNDQQKNKELELKVKKLENEIKSMKIRETSARKESNTGPVVNQKSKDTASLESPPSSSSQPNAQPAVNMSSQSPNQQVAQPSFSPSGQSMSPRMQPPLPPPLMNFFPPPLMPVFNAALPPPLLNSAPNYQMTAQSSLQNYHAPNFQYHGPAQNQAQFQQNNNTLNRAGNAESEDNQSATNNRRGYINRQRGAHKNTANFPKFKNNEKDEANADRKDRKGPGYNRGNFNRGAVRGGRGGGRSGNFSLNRDNAPTGNKNQTTQSLTDNNASSSSSEPAYNSSRQQHVGKKKDYQGVSRGKVARNRRGGGAHKNAAEFQKFKNNEKDEANAERSKKNDSKTEAVPSNTSSAVQLPLAVKKNKPNNRQENQTRPTKPSDDTDLQSDVGVLQQNANLSEDTPLSKKNLGKDDILMKYIGSNLPMISDAVFHDVSLFQAVDGVMLISDPDSNEPVLQAAKDLIHIVEFKAKYPSAKSFFV